MGLWNSVAEIKVGEEGRAWARGVGLSDGSGSVL